MDLGAEITLYAHRRLELRNQLDLFERTTENSIFSGCEIGLRDTLRAGYFAGGYLFGLELGWEQGLATYIAHSDWYRETAYPGATDGWLALPAGIFKTAIFGGGYPARHLFVGGQLGLDVDRTGLTGYLPIVATISAAYSF